MQFANVRKSRSGENLDRHYREIGIPAVVAAVRYRRETKNPAYAPVVHRRRERDLEALASAL